MALNGCSVTARAYTSGTTTSDSTKGRCTMTSELRTRTRPLPSQRLTDLTTTSSKWAQRRDIPIAILAWIALAAVALWAAAHIVVSLLLPAIAGLLAFALVPAVKLLQRVMPRFLAILIVYLIVFIALSLLVYFI